MPPRRVLDYAELYYDNTQHIDETRLVPYDGEMKIIEKRNPLPDQKNYYVLKDGKGYFIFNNYKTSDSYGSQYFEINPLLNDILQKYITTNKIPDGGKILPNNASDLSARLKKIFKCIVSKNVGASCLRHMFIIYMRGLSRLELICDQKKLAYQMAHSHPTQLEYWKDISGLCEEVRFNKSWSRGLFAGAGRPKESL